MAENENDSIMPAVSAADAAPPPTKKLKITLKLNSSSSSSTSTTSLESSNSATPFTSQISSSTTVSPIKTRPVTAYGLVPVSKSELASGSVNFSDLPTGLGNLKGRGRPKKANEPFKSADEPGSTNIPTSIAANSGSASSTNPKASALAESLSSEYSADLKSLVAAMKTFQSRKWSLKRPLLLETKNLANFELKWPAGLWTTETFELSTSHLSSVNSAANNNPASASVDHLAVFEATCKCGKVFNDRSKYRKHAKIHDKPVVVVEPVSSVNIVDDDKSVKNNNPTPIPMPTISLKLKLNTNSNSNSNNQT